MFLPFVPLTFVLLFSLWAIFWLLVILHYCLCSCSSERWLVVSFGIVFRSVSCCCFLFSSPCVLASSFCLQAVAPGLVCQTGVFGTLYPRTIFPQVQAPKWSNCSSELAPKRWILKLCDTNRRGRHQKNKLLCNNSPRTTSRDSVRDFQNFAKGGAFQGITRKKTRFLPKQRLAFLRHQGSEKALQCCNLKAHGSNWL